MLTTNLPEGSSFAFECIFQPEPICIAAIATEWPTVSSAPYDLQRLPISDSHEGCRFAVALWSKDHMGRAIL